MNQEHALKMNEPQMNEPKHVCEGCEDVREDGYIVAGHSAAIHLDPDIDLDSLKYLDVNLFHSGGECGFLLEHTAEGWTVKHSWTSHG